jgi:two-component system sensor histidine kinase DesK
VGDRHWSENLMVGGWAWDDDASLQPNGPQEKPRKWAWTGTLFLLPLLVPAVKSVFTDPHPLWWRVLALGLLAAYSACYLFFPLVLPNKWRTVRLLFCVGMLALGWGVVALFGFTSLYGLIYATAVIAFGLPPAWVLLLDGGSLLVFGVVAALTGHLGESADNLYTVASVTGALFFLGRLIRALRKLKAANDEIATLAVAGERERMARDLHDILGHSLTTITVKAGLARRVLENSGGRDLAIGEIRDVETLSRSALSDVRATVSEYREVSLSAELVGARVALRAGEIEADLPYAVDNVRPSLQSTFGYVLREAVTNVLRHSGARRVKVRLGDTWMEIEDDGTASEEVAAGNGITGLRERLALVGGTVRAECRPGGGFLVRADVPDVPEAPAVPARPAEIAGGLA